MKVSIIIAVYNEAPTVARSAREAFSSNANCHHSARLYGTSRKAKNSTQNTAISTMAIETSHGSVNR